MKKTSLLTSLTTSLVASALIVGTEACASAPHSRPAVEYRIGAVTADDHADIDAQAFRDETRSEGEALKQCYAASWKGESPTPGEVVMTFHIDARGDTVDIEVVEDGFPGRDIAACVGSVMARWQFPPPRSGQPVTVRYPLEFRQTPAP